LIPTGGKLKVKISDHPFLGMSSQVSKKSILEEIDDLRGSRYKDV
jgi:hypothetical protein